MTEAAAVAGIQETDLGAGGISLHARVRDMTPDRLRAALTVDKSLVMVWAMRGAPYIVPTDEMGVFTTGSLPTGEESLRAYFGGWAKSLSDGGSRLEDLVARAVEVATDVLDGRRLHVDEFRRAIAENMPEIRGLRAPSGATPISPSHCSGFSVKWAWPALPKQANDRCRHRPCRPMAGSGAGCDR